MKWKWNTPWVWLNVHIKNSQSEIQFHQKWSEPSLTQLWNWILPPCVGKWIQLLNFKAKTVILTGKHRWPCERFILSARFAAVTLLFHLLPLHLLCLSYPCTSPRPSVEEEDLAVFLLSHYSQLVGRLSDQRLSSVPCLSVGRWG